MTEKQVRPSWLEGVQETSSGALITVDRRDGSKVGYRIPKKSLLKIAREQDGSKRK